MKNKPCKFDYWRNYVPFAPDIYVDVSGSDVTEIDVGKLILQGSRDEETGHSPTPSVLDKVPAQRGWRHNISVVSPPTKGNAVVGTQGETIVFTPRSGLLGADCLNYVLTNGTQKSPQGRIILNIIKEYLWKLRLTRLNITKTLHRIETRDAHGSGVPSIKYMEVFWYYNQYQRQQMPDGTNRVYKRRSLAYSTQADYKGYLTANDYAPRITEAARTVEFLTQFDNYTNAFEGDTHIPYSPKGTQGDIEIEFVIYTEETHLNIEGHPVLKVDLNKPKKFLYKLSDKLGVEWWESGNIQQG